VAILSVDLAYRRWSDLGVVVLDRERPTALQNPLQASSLLKRPSFTLRPNLLEETEANERPIHCEILPFGPPEPGPELAANSVDPNILAGRLNHLCGVRGIRLIVLDGPQAWKSRSNGLEHARVSERQLNTAAKTGLPGMVKPVSYRPFSEFCLDVYEALCRRGWRRLQTREQPGCSQERVLVESYPYAAWKSLGLKPLPSKRRARISDLAEAYAALNSVIPFTTNRPPNHDQLQAIVGGLPGVALEEHNTAGARIVGNPPHREDGQWREGYIVLPVPPRTVSLRWLD
jgi:hypothetical protein